MFIIAKIKKKSILEHFGGGFDSFGDENASKLEFLDELFTIEDAENAINKFQKKLEEETDKDWDKQTDNEKEHIEKQFDEGKVYMSDTYFIIPVAQRIDISAIPKHRRKD